jgi:hypothetical protein
MPGFCVLYFQSYGRLRCVEKTDRVIFGCALSRRALAPNFQQSFFTLTARSRQIDLWLGADATVHTLSVFSEQSPIIKWTNGVFRTQAAR